MNERIMCIDYGDVRTGIAVSDGLGLIAVGLETITAPGDRALIEKIKEIASGYSIIKFIVGNPINMNGTRGERSEKAQKFAEKLSAATGIETELYDERCTTMQAHQIMNLTNTRGKKRKATIDTLSAQIILQNYMDSHKKTT